MTETIIPDIPENQEVKYEPQATAAELPTESEQPAIPIKGSALKSPKKRVLTILLVGETGSGKTSFVSLLLSLLQGKGPFELEEQHCVDAESGLDKTQSQTTDAKPYTFTTPDGVKFQIIDTPGLADTRGMEENNKHRERIYQAIKELATRIDAIMLVANGRNERVSVATSYTLETLATFFPRSIKDNIGILLTNVEPDGSGKNFQISCLPPDLQAAKYWCIDNPRSKYKNYWDTLSGLTESQIQKSKQVKRLKESYEETVQCLDEWLEWLDEREAMPTTAIIELYHKSTEIESRLFGTTLSLENMNRLRKELQELTRDFEAVEKKQKSLVELRNREAPMIWELEETSDYNTICLSSSCHSNCHTQCTLELSEPADLGGWCKVFKTLYVPNWLIPFKSNSFVKCSKCGHEASEHRNYRRLYQERPSSIYEKAVKNLQYAEKSAGELREGMSRIEKAIEETDQKIEESRREIPRLVDEMNSVSLSPNYAGYIRSAIQLLEMRKKHLDSQLDSDEELSVLNKGITAFKGHLVILKDTAATQVISASTELATYGKRALQRPARKIVALPSGLAAFGRMLAEGGESL
ncbi:hypothetical protein RSOLAG22IIIB_10254 [Rhizoctonia solani]|uniref:AIG1-type G domain-containing protein n=1 Tax=Rhizoctonia solani TaxID=456999 RepID=A0A0K6G2V3_9AGAM|nr:hypothetical protein RSOLAG22IIIB_10254 [Rhizoctonia solani]